MRGLFTITFCFTLLSLFAQQDKLYLKDGNILKGNVVNLDGTLITFAMANGDFIKVPTGNIIGHKAIGYQPGESEFKHISDSINSKYQNGPRLQIGMGLLQDDSGKGSDLNGIVNLDVTYRFGQYLQFGWGLAYHQYELVRSMPVYFSYQGDLTFNKRQGPYYFINVGKTTAWGNDKCECEAGSVKGGLYLSAGLGYRWDFDGKSLFIQGGWLQERITTTFANEDSWSFDSRLWGPNDSSTIIRQKLNSLNLIIGIKF